MVAIIAGSYAQFRNYLHEHGLNQKECIYAGNDYALKGIECSRFVRTGTYWDLPEKVIEEFDFHERMASMRKKQKPKS